MLQNYNLAIEHSSTYFYVSIAYNTLHYVINKEIQVMTDNEKMLLDIVRNSPDPYIAIEIAIEIISNFLKRPESFE
jgi:hypothetical protein